MGISRRDLFKTSGALAAGVALPAWMPRLAFRQRGQPAHGDVLVCVFQRGGMDGLSAVIPYQEQAYFDLRGGISFKAPTPGDAKSCIKLDDQFALNPALVGLKAAWDNGHLAVVHAAGSTDPTRSHFEAMDFMERGTPGQASINTGWLGRHLASTAQQTDSPFRAIGMGSMLQQSLRGPIPAAALQSIAEFHLQGRTQELANFRLRLQELYAGGDWFDDDAQNTFEALDILERANPLQYQPANGASYPNNAFGQGLKQIAQLIKADVGLEVACIDLGGWDTHVNQAYSNYNDPTRGQMFSLLQQFNDGLYAFYRDLGAAFSANPGVTLVTMSEFGRRVAQNSANGTDHGHGNCMFIMSGAAMPGMHVQWPGLGPANLTDGDLAITTDYRDILAEIVQKRLGNTQLDAVFPGHTAAFKGVVRDLAGNIPPPTAQPSPTATRDATAEPTREPTRVPTRPDATRTPTPGDATRVPTDGPPRRKIYLPQVRKWWPDSR